jgi:hypothetical protein
LAIESHDLVSSPTCATGTGLATLLAHPVIKIDMESMDIETIIAISFLTEIFHYENNNDADFIDELYGIYHSSGSSYPRNEKITKKLLAIE